MKWKYHLFDDTGKEHGSKLRTYRLFKETFEYEDYLDEIKDDDIKKNIIKSRIGTSNLMIEKGRHTRPKKTPLNERLCHFCNALEDEEHVLTDCKKFEIYRSIMFDEIKHFNREFCELDKRNKFLIIMKMKDIPKPPIIKYIRSIIKERGQF